MIQGSFENQTYMTPNKLTCHLGLSLTIIILVPSTIKFRLYELATILTILVTHFKGSTKLTVVTY